jgi:methionine-rich copper-binding protein CopC
MPTPLPRARRSRLRISAAALGTAALLAVGASVALAHDPLAATNAYVPANGSVVTGALPPEIIVSFQNTFRLAGSDKDPSTPIAAVLDPNGTDHVASAEQNPNDAKQLLIYTNDRTVAGKYTVTWTITANDGDVVSNNGSDVSEEGAPLIFTVQNAAGSSQTVSGTSTAGSTSSTPATTTAKSRSHRAAIVGIGVAVLAVIAVGAGLFWNKRRKNDGGAPGSR